MLEEDETFTEKNIHFIDGLVIDREDDKDDWLIEVYMEKEYLPFFEGLRGFDELLIQVKISKESNDPAFFVVKIAKVTDILERFSVLFSGKLMQRQTKDMATLVQELIAQGYYGKQLIHQLKQLS